MSILANQRIKDMSVEAGGPAAEAFGPTGSKDGTSDEADRFIYKSPSNVYSPPPVSDEDVVYTTQFHQSGGVKKGLAGQEITSNASPTVYGPHRDNRIQKTDTTLLTTLAQLNADITNLSTDYHAHDYFDSRQPRALKSYYSAKESADPKFLVGYDADNLYPDNVTQTETGETVAVPVDSIKTGLLVWLTTTPGESSAEGESEEELDPAFSPGWGYEYESINIAQDRLNYLADQKMGADAGTYGYPAAGSKVHSENMLELSALVMSDALVNPFN